jgi:hypothetical protein
MVIPGITEFVRGGLLDPPSTDDGNRWVDGFCWLYCGQFGSGVSGGGEGGVVEEFPEGGGVGLDGSVRLAGVLSVGVVAALIGEAGGVAQDSVGLPPAVGLDCAVACGGGLLGGEAFAQAVDGQFGGELGRPGMANAATMCGSVCSSRRPGPKR